MKSNDDFSFDPIFCNNNVFSSRKKKKKGIKKRSFFLTSSLFVSSSRALREIQNTRADKYARAHVRYNADESAEAKHGSERFVGRDCE